ncbi:MAG: SRPBCC domain-containing protein [Calditrichaeota bacterium]|nr:MAG: SRPBCC domain-containing protein [Calditrichota bacterium]
MSTLKQLQFSILIHAPVKVVWDKMLGAETYTRWTAPFTEGSYFEGEWDEGSKIKFLSPSGDGMIAEIAENRPHEFISIRHIGFIVDGVEDTESDSVRSWAPAYENYTFQEQPEGTLLTIDQDVTPDFEEYMKEVWPKALQILKQLCEEHPSE